MFYSLRAAATAARTTTTAFKNNCCEAAGGEDLRAGQSRTGSFLGNGQQVPGVSQQRWNSVTP